MTSFLAIEGYSPFLVLATGLFTFVGLWGAGTIVLYAVRLHFPSPWNQVTRTLLGVMTVSLLVQIAGMAGIASLPVLRAIWWTIVASGTVLLLLRVRSTLARPFARIDRAALLPMAILGAAMFTNLLVALAPSTKIDEIYYHMLVPSRIVADGMLRFFREPWEAAVWPQMVFQISGTPVHAVGQPDAVNVVSWALSATLVWFAWSVIRARTNTEAWSALWAGSLCVGMYPVVWFVTGGAHAMGDLAMAAAVVAFCSREHLLTHISQAAFGALISILLLSAAVTKISLLPLCVSLLCLATWTLFRLASKTARWRVLIAVTTPWIVFYFPIALWTWVQSGSPFGPVDAGVFVSSMYFHTRLQQTFESIRIGNQGSLLLVLQRAAVRYSPLVWLGVIGAFCGTSLSREVRLILACLLALQCILIYRFLPYDARFLGGLHFGLLIVFGGFVASDYRRRFATDGLVTFASVVFLLPWLAVQIYYGKQFIPVALGLEKSAFYERYIPFYTDFRRLDEILPNDAVLLFSDLSNFRLGAVYAPRQIFLDPDDVPKGREVALFASPETVRSWSAVRGYKVGKLIYENPQAIIKTYRTPGRPRWIGPLQVVQLIRD